MKSAVKYNFDDNQSVRLIQITDPHLFADPESKLLGVNTAKSLQAVIDTFLSSSDEADLLIASGDISQDYSSTSYHNFVQQIASAKLPCHYLPGNHDDPRMMALHMQGDNVFGQQRIIAGDWQILMLDSTVRGKPGGYMGEVQFELIDAAIEAEPHKHVLLVMHHNPILMQCSWLDQHCMANGDEFIQRVTQYPQVKGLLWGHVHQQVNKQHAGPHGKVEFMATPSTCIQFKPLSDHFALDGVQPGYRLLELRCDGSIRSDVYRVQGQHFSPDNEASGY
nr:3',5'-cyclic-AMP phosphodiesterase [Shewanella gaetbuli]